MLEVNHTVIDVWGENDATIVGTPSIVNGHLKDALKFDGIKDYVNLTTLGNFGAKLDFSTVEVWIKTDYKETWTTIFKMIGTDCRNQGTMIWGIDINRMTNDRRHDVFGPAFIFGEDSMLLYLPSVIENKNGCSLSILTGRLPISDGKWHHLVYTTQHEDKNERSERAFFIDGTLNRISKSNPFIPNDFQYKYVPFSHPVYLGAGNDRGRAEGFFNGIIDEVRLYDRVLTDAEIIRNYQSTMGLDVDRADKLPTVWGALKKTTE